MKRFIKTTIALIFTVVAISTAQTFEFSQGIYRIPFADGETVNVSRDHLTHSPVQNRIDMWAPGAPSSIVAAADGWIRPPCPPYRPGRRVRNMMPVSSRPGRTTMTSTAAAARLPTRTPDEPGCGVAPAGHLRRGEPR